MLKLLYLTPAHRIRELRNRLDTSATICSNNTIYRWADNEILEELVTLRILQGNIDDYSMPRQ